MHNMHDFEKALAAYIGKEGLEKIQRLKIGIAGAGGLGSNCAFNLVRSGFKNFKIVDFDVVEISNIDRQFYFIDQISTPKVKALKANLLRINPGIKVDTVITKIVEESIESLFMDCDVIVEAFDKADCKAMLVEKFYSSGKFLVSASGISGYGNSDDIKIKKIHDRFFVVGDLVTEVGVNKPPLSPRVNIAAAKQADLILEYALKNYKMA